MTAMENISFLWDDQELFTYSSLLDRLVNALGLFLQAIQWYVSPLRLNAPHLMQEPDFAYSNSKSLGDKQDFINDEDSRSILRKAEDCDTSIIGMPDGVSILSEATNHNSISLDFDVLLGSQAYKSAYRSILRRKTMKAGYSEQSVSNSSRPQTLDPVRKGSVELTPVADCDTIGSNSAKTVERMSSSTLSTDTSLKLPKASFPGPGRLLEQGSRVPSPRRVTFRPSQLHAVQPLRSCFPSRIFDSYLITHIQYATPPLLWANTEQVSS